VPLEDLFDNRLAAHGIECERRAGIRVEGDMEGVHGLLSDKQSHVRVIQDGARLFYEGLRDQDPLGPGPRANIPWRGPNLRQIGHFSSDGPIQETTESTSAGGTALALKSISPTRAWIVRQFGGGNPRWRQFDRICSTRHLNGGRVRLR
jgi:hypothetical protein